MFSWRQTGLNQLARNQNIRSDRNSLDSRKKFAKRIKYINENKYVRSWAEGHPVGELFVPMCTILFVICTNLFADCTNVLKFVQICAKIKPTRCTLASSWWEQMWSPRIPQSSCWNVHQNDSSPKFQICNFNSSFSEEPQPNKWNKIPFSTYREFGVPFSPL